jgi:hypothetical protein
MRPFSSNGVTSAVPQPFQSTALPLPFTRTSFEA